MPTRIKSVVAHRLSICRKLTLCINPIHEEQYPKKILNIFTDQVLSDAAINVDKSFLSVNIGKQQMDTFEKNWPKGIHDSLHKFVKTYPTAMVDGNWLREAKSKAVLMNDLKVEVSRWHFKSDSLFIDGCDFLYVVPWTKKDTVQYFLNAFCHSLQKQLCNSEVFPIFDS